MTMLASFGVDVPLLPSGAKAVWNRRVELFLQNDISVLQDEMNAFLEELGIGVDFALGAAVLHTSVQEDGANYIGLIDYGFYSET